MGSNIQNLIDSVKNKYGWNDKQLAESLGVSAHSVISWKSGRRSPKRSIEIELEKLGEEQKGEDMQDKQYIIELQKEKILNLEEQLKKQKSNQDNAYGLGMPDCSCEFDVEVNWSGSVAVRYRLNKGHQKAFAKNLGYTENEIIKFFGVDEMIPYKIHPIHGLRTPARKKEMLSSISNYLKFFKGVKISTTEMTAEFPVTYSHKDGHDVHCLNEYRVNWVAGNGSCNIRFQK
jgi:transcriptional regulator with XRE-family HTH domain